MQTDKVSGNFLDYSVNNKSLSIDCAETDSLSQNLRRVASVPENLPPLSQASPAIRPRCYSFQGTLIATRNQRGDYLVKDMYISQLSPLGAVHPHRRSYIPDINNPLHGMPARGEMGSQSVIINMPEEDSKSYGNNSLNSQSTQIFLIDAGAELNANDEINAQQKLSDQLTITLQKPQLNVRHSGNNYWADLHSKENMDALQRHAKNIGKVLSRNMLSVAIPTAMREYMAKNILPLLLRNAPGTANIALAGIALAVPIALQLLGIARDLHAGTQTRASLSARLANIAMITGAGSALVATGGVAAAANALIAAVFVYVPIRDALQYFVKLGDNNKPSLNLSVCSKSAVVYTANQVLVSEGMDMLALALEPLLGKAAANMVGKALVNTAGEAADEITFRTLNASEQENPAVEYSLNIRPADEINLKTGTDLLMNTITARSSLFATTFAAANAVPYAGVLSSIVIGGALGAGYIPFFFCHAQKAPDPLDRMEAGLESF